MRLGLGLGIIQQKINSGGGEVGDFIMTVKTDNVGTSSDTQFTIPALNAPNYNITTTDGHNLTGLSGAQTLTFSSAGTYDINISGEFNRLAFDNGGDKLKLLEIKNWGIYGANSTTQASAFYGCTNLSAIANDAGIDTGINLITNGLGMFRATGLTNQSYPSRLILPNIVEGSSMFYQSGINGPLPEGMVLNTLTSAASMFRECGPIGDLPSTFRADNLVDARNFLMQCDLTSLPEGLTFNSVTLGESLLQNNAMLNAGLPSTLELASMTNAEEVFRLTNITYLPPNIDFALITNGTQSMRNTNIGTARYTQLLIDMEANNANNNVVFWCDATYEASAATARANLVSRGWTITDNGPA
jgi:hypothetical protein